MRIPKAMQDVIDSFQKLPGIGPKSAQRLTYYLFHMPQGEIDKFSSSLQKLKIGTILCSTCFTIGETDPCMICSDAQRDQHIICVVEQPLDVLAIEKGGTYKGLYHVLHGRIDPLNNIGPDEIYIAQLLARVAKAQEERDAKRVLEIILATNPTMEGEATAMFLAKQLKVLNNGLRITRIGRGLPMGADLEYADDMTLQRAMEGRRDFSV